MFYLIYIGVLLIVLLILFIFRKKDNIIDNIFKVITILFMSLIFINVFLPDGLVVSLSQSQLANVDGLTIFLVILRWFSYVSFLVMPVAIFYKKKVFVKIALYFCLPIVLINLVMYSNYLPFLTTSNIRGLVNIRFFSLEFKEFMTGELFRSILFGIVSLLEIISLIYIIYKNTDKIKFISIKEVFIFIVTLIGLIAVIIPIYLPQYLIGYTDIIFESYTLIHLGWILLLSLTFILLTLIFKKQSQVNKYILVLILSLSLLIQYNQMFSAINELTFSRMPLQLCNIGAYLMLITILTRNKKLFSFTLVANVVGALIALGVMDVDGMGIGYLWNIHFILEHSGVVIIPLLCLSLGIFPKVDKKDIRYVLGGFIIYFIIVLGLGTYLNSIYLKTGNDFFKVNYLFMFDRETATNLIPLTKILFDTKIKIGLFEYYPLIQTTVLFVFLSLCIGMFYFLYWVSNFKRYRK